MEPDRLRLLLADVAGASSSFDGNGRPSALDRVIRQCVQILPVRSAGIFLMSDGEHRGIVSVSDDLARRLEEIQDTANEGPCLEAYRTRQMVREPDLSAAGMRRWPRFTGPALDAGVAAVFSWPLQFAGLRFGAIDLFRDTPGDFDDDEIADGWILADIASHTILEAQSHATPGDLAEALRRSPGRRERIEQAKGMVAVQLGVGISEATQRMRATAHSEERSLYSVADDILEGALRL